MGRSDPKVVADRLNASRQNLLDLSRRNPLISFRPSRASGLEVEGEDPFEVFRLLVQLGKAMSFSGIPDEQRDAANVNSEDLFYVDAHDDAASLAELRADAEREMAEFIGPGGVAVDPTDLILSARERESKLQGRLLKTFRDARTIVEESGVNVLFLALGMLKWVDSDASSSARRAPLILVPVALEQRANGEFRVKHDGGDISENASLRAMLKAEFGLALPECPDADTCDVRAYFANVSKAVTSQAKWAVDSSSIVLGFFRYAKYFMYTDLDEANWPDGRKPSANEILTAILDSGFEDAGDALPDDSSIDARRPATEIHDVVGADASQSLAVMEAARGRSMVIQGPPGTGKSQTITNLIADALARGKTVLFVAEKIAALEVVARRLRSDALLGDACLELHSQKANKTEFYEELRRVQLTAPEAAAADRQEQARFEEARTSLNAYCNAVNVPLEPHGIAPRDAMGRIIELKPDATGHRFDFAAMAEWSQGDFAVRRELIDALCRRLVAMGPPSNNPFFGAGLRVVVPVDLPLMVQSWRNALRDVRALREQSCELAESMGLGDPNSLEDLAKVCAAARLAGRAPNLEGVTTSSGIWASRLGEVDALLALLEEASALHAEFSGRLAPEAWSENVAPLSDALARHGNRWYRWLLGEYREARRTCRRLCHDEKVASQKEALAAVARHADLAKQVAAGDALGREAFGAHWKGMQSDGAALRSLATWMGQVLGEVRSGDVPAGLLAFLDRHADTTALQSVAARLLEQTQAWMTEIHGVCRRLELHTVDPALITSFSSVEAKLGAWIERPEELDHVVALNRLGDEAEALGLGFVMSFVVNDPLAPSELASAFDATWYEGLVRKGFAERPALAGFNRLVHEDTICKFRTADDELLQGNRLKLRRAHHEAVPRVMAAGMTARFQSELAKKRRHISIRKALGAYCPIIQRIKPVFMMSPLSVAMFLPQDGPIFDLVIFDEASQVKPEDAFGAILRGRQVVVVGDDKQMPPTSFFDRMTSVDDGPEDDEAEETDVTRDRESILRMMDFRLGPAHPGRRMLRWHYRSRHHSLIEPSNAMFYEHQLFLVPDPAPPDENLGLSLVHLANTTYDRSASRTNREEAAMVATAVLNHVRSRPHESLMVVAFSQAQQQAVQDAMDLLIGNEPSVVSFAERHGRERLEVKNLENVQGDERDVVFISVGYGRDRDGVAHMNFGPLNGANGARRLNVLITRARLRTVVFTNLRAEDIRAEATGGGLWAFREFLSYAETGRLGDSIATGRDPMSPFEDAVIARLTEAGYEVEPQVGCAGFFIDIGVVHPLKPGRYVLGIECDGAQYHSSRSARDRDKLRQMVLEDRGWRIHRIWSTDWFSKPDHEMERIAAAVSRATALSPPDYAPPVTAAQVAVTATAVPPIPAEFSVLKAPPYRVAKLQAVFDLAGMSQYELATLVVAVATAEAPVHRDELVRRLREAAGAGRAGSVIRAAIDRGIRAAGASGVSLKDDFVMLAGKETVVRDRSQFVAVNKKLDYVCDEEIALALKQVVASGIEVPMVEAASAACRLLGFDRTTEAMQSRCEAVADRIVRAHWLSKMGATLSLPIT